MRTWYLMSRFCQTITICQTRNQTGEDPSDGLVYVMNQHEESERSYHHLLPWLNPSYQALQRRQVLLKTIYGLGCTDWPAPKCGLLPEAYVRTYLKPGLSVESHRDKRPKRKR